MWDKVFFGGELVCGLNKWAVFWRGVLAVILGFLLFLRPALAAMTLALIMGWIFFMGGVWIAVESFMRKEHRVRWLLYGILLLLVGLALLLFPPVDVLFLSWGAAMFFMTSGVAGITVSLAFPAKRTEKTFNMIVSILSVVLGLLLFFEPIAGLVEFLWISGAVLVAEGALVSITALLMPSTASEPVEAKECAEKQA